MELMTTAIMVPAEAETIRAGIKKKDIIFQFRRSFRIPTPSFVMTKSGRPWIRKGGRILTIIALGIAAR